MSIIILQRKLLPGVILFNLFMEYSVESYHGHKQWLYNHPAEIFFGGRILGKCETCRALPPPPTPTPQKSAYKEQGFFSLSKIQRYMDQETFKSECLMCAHKTGTKESTGILVIPISQIEQKQQSVQ